MNDDLLEIKDLPPLETIEKQIIEIDSLDLVENLDDKIYLAAELLYKGFDNTSHAKQYYELYEKFHGVLLSQNIFR